MSTKIMTKHLLGKQGVRIDKDKYDTIKNAIIGEISKAGELTFQKLMQQLNKKLGKSFEGSVGWYVTTIKLDLEARRIIERVGTKSPQVLRLK